MAYLVTKIEECEAELAQGSPKAAADGSPFVGPMVDSKSGEYMRDQRGRVFRWQQGAGSDGASEEQPVEPLVLNLPKKEPRNVEVEMKNNNHNSIVAGGAAGGIAEKKKTGRVEESIV